MLAAGRRTVYHSAACFHAQSENGQAQCRHVPPAKYDGQTTGMHWHLHKDGASNYRAYKEMGMDKIEVAVAIGTDPVVTYSATAPLPRDIDEMVFAGFLRKKSVEW